MPACRRFGLGILPWSPLAQGVLTGKYAGGRDPQDARLGGTAPTPAAAQWRARFRNERSERIVDAVLAVAARIEATPTAVSLAWLLRKPVVSSVIVGPKTVAQLDQNLAACATSLDDATMRELDAASEPPARYPESFIAGTQRNATP